MRTAAAAVASAAVLALVGCSTTAHAPKAAPSTSTASTLAPSPSVTQSARPRLTRKQAARLYVALVDPSNRLLPALVSDVQDKAPLAKFRADTRAYIEAIRVLDRKLLSYRWPLNVQPYITTLVTTYDVATIACARAQLRATSYSQQRAIVNGPECAVSRKGGRNAATIRDLLGLPSVQQ